MRTSATKTAIGALGLLARSYEDGIRRVPAKSMAESLDLPQPFLSKVLTTLVQAGFVDSTRGPGGGFALQRHPSEITLADVVMQFERESEFTECPVGGGQCGDRTPCPLHEHFEEARQALDRALQTTTFAAFLKHDG
ncbi:MAG: Rrf2 family transcriptional regulator [Phycisphaerales bacterium]